MSVGTKDFTTKYSLPYIYESITQFQRPNEQTFVLDLSSLYEVLKSFSSFTCNYKVTRDVGGTETMEIQIKRVYEFGVGARTHEPIASAFLHQFDQDFYMYVFLLGVSTVLIKLLW